MYNLNDKIVTFLPPSSIEPQAKQQLQNIAELPFLFHHLAVMPDCHLGKGATVGSVIATEGAIIPAAVGVDVGCGMIAVRTKFLGQDLPDNLDKLRTGIERRIPLGAGVGNKSLTDTAAARIGQLKANARHDYEKVDPKWTNALGTLGSGNHFIEVCLDETSQVWVVLHSGSRGIGNRLATKHITVAQRLLEEQSISLKDRDLAFLTENTPEFKNYMDDLLWAQLDSWLPDGWGVDLCKKIREFDSHTRIVFYSAAAYDGDRDSALKSGAQAYLTKPTDSLNLSESLSRLIAENKNGSDGSGANTP